MCVCVCVCACMCGCAVHKITTYTTRPVCETEFIKERVVGEAGREGRKEREREWSGGLRKREGERETIPRMNCY